MSALEDLYSMKEDFDAEQAARRNDQRNQAVQDRNRADVIRIASLDAALGRAQAHLLRTAEQTANDLPVGAVGVEIMAAAGLAEAEVEADNDMDDSHVTPARRGGRRSPTDSFGDKMSSSSEQLGEYFQGRVTSSQERDRLKAIEVDAKIERKREELELKSKLVDKKLELRRDREKVREAQEDKRIRIEETRVEKKYAIEERKLKQRDEERKSKLREKELRVEELKLLVRCLCATLNKQLTINITALEI